MRFVYSDINFELLGEIVHRLSGKPLDQSGEPRPLRCEVPFIRRHQALHRRRILAHRLIVAKHHRFDDPPNHPAQKHSRRS